MILLATDKQQRYRVDVPLQLRRYLNGYAFFVGKHIKTVVADALIIFLEGSLDDLIARLRHDADACLETVGAVDTEDIKMLEALRQELDAIRPVTYDTLKK